MELLDASNDYEQSGPNELPMKRANFQAIKDKVIAALTAAAQVGEPVQFRTIMDTYGRVVKADTIERCAQWLIDEARAIRAGVSGGDGTELGWVEADALDEAAAAIRKLKDE